MTNIRPYRGKRKNGVWEHGQPLETDNGIYIVPIGAEEITVYGRKHIPWDSLVSVIPETVGQYIGVHDDEGDNELFEGDNIKMIYQGEVITGNIQYCGGGFILASDDFEDGFMWISDLTENDGRHFWIPTAEVIQDNDGTPTIITVDKGEG